MGAGRRGCRWDFERFEGELGACMMWEKLGELALEFYTLEFGLLCFVVLVWTWA